MENKEKNEGLELRVRNLEKKITDFSINVIMNFWISILIMLCNGAIYYLLIEYGGRDAPKIGIGISAVALSIIIIRWYKTYSELEIHNKRESRY